MKAKIFMCITIGVICILLTSVMFLQFKSVQIIEESGVGIMREAELRTEYALLKEKSDELEKTLLEVEESISEYNIQSVDTQGTIELLRKDVNKARVDLGYTDVKGPGLIITILDDKEKVSSYSLLYAINELKFAGAEAISINGERVVNTTDIADITDKHISMNKARIFSPYEIKVIGDIKYLESVINMKNELKDTIEAEGLKISYTVENEVFIEKYDGELEINW